MQRLDTYIQNNPGKVFFFLLILAIPAFFINLGLMPLFADESTRANVALEMLLSKNFWVPTIGGEYYYNKPPLYNWILAGLYSLTGNYSEFTTRLPAVIPMFLFAITIYFAVGYFLKDKRVALVSGIFFMVNGRMLLYDSMLGHIDIFYSWLTFISFMSIFYFYQKQRWFMLFFTSYLITAITFLCKGMPSIVFQGFTLLTLLIYSGNIKKLFSWQHILSGLLCLSIIGAYFYNYSLYNDNLEGYFNTIWNQSSQRTAANTSLAKTFKHLAAFPFEHLAHLFPASLFILFCLHKGFINGIRKNEFLKFLSLTFLANIWIYWLSPETRPRYLLMLYPLLIIVLAHAYYAYRNDFPRINKVFHAILLLIAVLITLAVPAALFADLGQVVPAIPFKVLLVFSLCALAAWSIYKLEKHKFIPFILLLLTVRLGFSWFVLPHRYQRAESVMYKNISTEMGMKTAGQPFYLYQYHPEVLSIPFHDRLIFYIERSRMSQVKFVEDDVNPGYYLTFDRDLKNPKAVLLQTYEGNLKLFKVE